MLVPGQGEGVTEFRGLANLFRYLILEYWTQRMAKWEPIIPIEPCGNLQ